MVNQEMQTASISASLGYWGSRSGIVASTIPTWWSMEGKGRKENGRTVEMTTKRMDIFEIVWAALDVSGFSIKSQRQIWARSVIIQVNKYKITLEL